MGEIRIGFIGAGGIARTHAYALQALKYYYDDVPPVYFETVSSATSHKRESFAQKFGFEKAESEEEFFKNKSIDTVYILGPNKVHYTHLKRAIGMQNVSNIYLEKPVCASKEEEQMMWDLLEELKSDVKIQIGFQYLQTASVREALNFWKSGKLGKPIHFEIKYYHGDYLQQSYRDKRQSRLTAAPDGGAMADLGSHAISMLVAFLGEKLKITGALQGGNFDDVTEESDLFSSISIIDEETKAVGNLSASRISAGTGDMIQLELYAEKGVLKYSSHNPEVFEYFLEERQEWITKTVGSHYKPVSSFPSGHVPPGWLRSMVHAHYIFLGGRDKRAFIPDLKHGLEVQRLVRETATHLSIFRKNLK